MYLKLSVAPWPLVIHYDIPRLDTFAAAWPWLVPVGLLGLGTLWLLWRRSAIGFLAAAVFLILSPTLVVPIITEVAAERRMYLPMAALIAMLICGGYALATRAQPAFATTGGHGRAWPLAAIVGSTLVLVVVFGSLSVRRLMVYQNELTLWQDTFARQPHDPVTRNNLATTLINLGNDLGAQRKHEQSLAYYRRASEVRPDEVLGHLGLANALYCLNRLDEVDLPLSRAAACQSNDVDRCQIDVLLGMLRIAQRRPGEAIDPLQRALAINSLEPVALYLYGMALSRQGDTTLGAEKLRESVRIRSDLPIAQYELGRTLFSLGKPEQAVAHFQRAVELAPNEANYHQDLAASLSRVGNLADAESQLREAIQLNPNSANAHNLLGVVYVQKGNLTAAIAQFKTALEIMPTHQDALKNMAKVQQQVRGSLSPTE